MSALKIGIAMSGGVDSTVAASLLRADGHEVHGFFMLLPLPHLHAQVQRVREVADRLSVPLHCIDLRQRFSDEVVRYFVDAYRAGQTPNPCVHCNRMIKFGTLAETLLQQGMDKMATGHYARIRPVGTHFSVFRGADRLKDQSYFLARLSSAQLRHIVFPLGDWTKEAVYEHADTLGFQFRGEESQDVCFLTAGLAPFLAEQGLADTTGPIVTLDGIVLGEHRGVWNYTIGQRRGLGLPDATPWYVVAIDGRKNRLVVGKNADLQQTVCTVHSLEWASSPAVLPWRGHVQLRSRHTPAAAEVCAAGADNWKITFETPQRAITPGQFAVFYEEERVLGSAVIGMPDSVIGAGTP